MAFGRIEDESLLVGFLPEGIGRISDASILVGILPEGIARVEDISFFVGYLAPPFALVGFQSGADAIEDLPNSGASSPFQSNRDAARGIK